VILPWVKTHLQFEKNLNPNISLLKSVSKAKWDKEWEESIALAYIYM
jgi:hypothetical protein